MKHIIALLVAMLPLSMIHAQKATIGPRQTATFKVQSVPSGAKVYCDGKLVCASTPGVVNLSYYPIWKKKQRKEDQMLYIQRLADSNAFTLTFVKDGYETVEEVITPTYQAAAWKNMYKYPESVIVELPSNGTDPNDPTIRRGAAQQRVSRDNAGQTALERTIIRWYFESDPAGARVFWRVISSVPDEVKNTNETYLGTTPFEETRSFNILGLTYENSRDVQVEIKLRRKGYYDQTKRFNVRQAIDQQEISSFFDLVRQDGEE